MFVEMEGVVQGLPFRASEILGQFDANATSMHKFDQASIFSCWSSFTRNRSHSCACFNTSGYMIVVVITTSIAHMCRIQVWRGISQDLLKTPYLGRTVGPHWTHRLISQRRKLDNYVRILIRPLQFQEVNAVEDAQRSEERATWSTSYFQSEPSEDLHGNTRSFKSLIT
jgi:hypothetical protein